MIPLLLLVQQPAFLVDLKPAWVVRGTEAAPRSLLAAMKEHHIRTLSLTIFKDGQVTFSQVIGGEGAPAIDDSYAFQFGSLSKVVAALTALRLVDQGKLKLDEPIDGKLGDWKLPTSPFTEKQHVTLRRLLTHTAGFAVGGFLGYEQGSPVPTLTQMLDGISPANSPGMSFESEPGAKWKYSGGGYLVLQKLIESVTKRPYADVASNVILQPANLKNSGFVQPTTFVSACDVFGVPVRGHVHPELTAAGLWSTPTDFARLLLNVPSLLKKDTLASLITKGLGDWGLGVGVRGQSIWHSGRNVGYDTLFSSTTDFRSGFVAAIDSNNDTGFMEELQDAVFRSEKWPNPPAFATRQAENIPDTTLDSFAGTYVQPQIGKVEVRRDRFRLFMNYPVRGWIALTPTSHTRFDGLGVTAAFTDGSCELLFGKRTVKLMKKA